MGNEVYANNMEVSCKAANGKSICCFPDVCMTPPQTPATPPGVPIPYPNTGMASDCTDGSSTVKISGQEVMLKNKSYFKKSTGDEAGCAPMKGVVTAKNTGKVYFNAWSMDVLVEGENVVRNLDITTHNHNSPPGNTATWPYVDAAAGALNALKNCGKEAEAVQKNCKEEEADPCPGILKKGISSTRSDINDAWEKKGGSESSGTRRLGDSATANAEGRKGACTRAMRCLLRPYSAKPRDGLQGCCPGQTPHHIPPWSTTKTVSGIGGMVNHSSALCICLEGASHSVGSHGKHHHGINYILDVASAADGGGVTSGLNSAGDTVFQAPLSEHVKASAAVTEAQNGCSKECIEEQLNSQFGEDNLKKNATHNASRTGGTEHSLMDGESKAAAQAALVRPPAAPSIG